MLAPCPLTVERDEYRQWRVLYRGTLACSGPGAMSWFNRKAKAEAFADFLRRLLGSRLHAPEGCRPDYSERRAIEAELLRLQA